MRFPSIKAQPYLTKKHFKDLVYIYTHFGKKVQEKKLHEEIDELNKALTPEEFSEELADVCILALQFVLCDAKVQHHFIKKIERTLERIDGGYYDNQMRNK